MSMLAERRRKQKWSLNPRGKEWSSDSNKFGQKLMEKMGWSAGKGLGAKEDGITEHIKVSYKNDSRGMGFKESDTQWTEHESNFSELLNSLTGTDTSVPDKDDEIKLESLEKKSQKSRARVHYHKFTRGKDLSRYSEKDLANIFGRKNLKKIEPKNIPEYSDKNTESTEKSYGVETHNGGSMLEYFKKKMPNYKKYNVNGNKSESDDERPAFGFGFNADKQVNPTAASFVSYVEPYQNGTEEKLETNNVEIGTVSKKKRKFQGELDIAFTPLKKKSKKFESLNSLDDDEPMNGTPIKKKNGSKEEENTNGSVDGGLTNPAFDPLFTTVKMDKRPLEAIQEMEEDFDDNVKIEGEETGYIKKKSNKESSKNPANGLSNINGNINSPETENNVTGKKKSKKSKKHKIKGTDNEGFGEHNEKTIPIESSENIESLPTMESNGITSFNGGIENSGFEDFVNETSVKKDKKSKKSKDIKKTEIFLPEDQPEQSFHSESSQSENKTRKVRFSDINEICDLDSNVREFTAKPCDKKSSKMKNCKGIENACFEDFQEDQIVENNVNSTPPSNKKSKKSKKGKKSDAGVENNAFDENSNTTPIVMDNSEEFEVKRKSKKRKYEEAGINNPCFEDNHPNTNEKKSTSVEDSMVNSMPEEADDLVLNVSSTPSKDKDSAIDQNNKKVKRGKKDKDNGRNVNSLSKQLDDCQATVENDINQAREYFIGEPDESDGENAVLPSGDVKLKLKNAKFGKTPKWLQKNKDPSNPKSSYRHLIKGDIVLGFKNTNLHKIQGYDPSKQSMPQ